MTTYYLANAGNDGDTGLDPAHPWQTIARLNAEALSGDDYARLNCGDSWHGQITPTHSGSVGHYITYSWYGTGDRPIIYGDTDMCGCFIDEGYHHLRFEHIDFSGSNASNYPAFFNMSHDIYVYDCIGRDSQYWGFGGWSMDGTYLYNYVIDTSQAYDNHASGICISSNTAIGGPHDCEVKYNLCHDNGTTLWADHGIYPRYGVSVHHNICWNNPVGGGIKCNNEGIDSDWSPVIYSNICFANFIGIYAVHAGALIFNNLIYGNEYNVNFDSDSHDMMVVFNTIVNATTAAFLFEGNFDNTVIQNNFIVQDRTSYPYWLYTDLGSNLLSYLAAHNTIDNNVIWTDGISSTDIFHDYSGSIDWTQWKALTGSPDAHSTFLGSLPEVVARYTDMHPLSGSGGGYFEGLGVTIGGYDTDKDGVVRSDPPTPGCYDFAEESPPPVVPNEYGPSAWMIG